jgi:hypothetical protein
MTRMARSLATLVASLAFVLTLPSGARGQAVPSRAVDADGASGSLQGRITAEAEGGGPALGYALVELRLGTAVRSQLTDSEGRFRFSDLPAGRAIVRAHYLGHRPRTLEVLLPPSRALTLDLTLTPEALVIPGITVVAEPLHLPDPDGAGPLRPVTAGADVELALLQITPGLAEAALAPGSGRGSGGQDPADPRQILLMRGSTADLKLVLLDGAPVYTPFHLGGLVESFDAGTLGRAGHHVGGAPARYDGGLSYILDLETRRPSGETEFRGALDLLSLRASGESSVGPIGVMASSRVLHNGGPRMLQGAPSPYGYADGLLRTAQPLFGGRAELGFTAFGNREEVRLGNEHTPLAPEAARWGNGLLSARLTHDVGSAALRWTAALSRYEAELPLRPDTGDASNPVLARGETGRLRLALDADRPLGSGRLRFGASLDEMDLHYASRLLTRSGVVRTDARSDGRVAGAYGEIERPLGPMVVGRLGGRVDHFSPEGFRGALRGALAWSVTDDAILSLTAGRYHQLTRAADPDIEQALIPEARTTGPEGVGISGDTPFLSVATGDHVVLGLDQRLGGAVELGMRGFYKRFTGVGLGDGLLTSSGVDVRLQAAGGGRTGWLGYALSWSWEGHDAGFTDRFSGRHLLSAGFRGPVRGPVGLDLRVAFSDGLPYTEVSLGASATESLPTPGDLQNLVDDEPALTGGTPADGFLRLALELYAEWDAPWAGRRGRIRPYVRLMNALDRRDALFYYFEPWRSPDLEPLAERPVLPVFGVAWTF